MVRADFDIEGSENEQELGVTGNVNKLDKKKGAKTAKDRAAFFLSKYGDPTNTKTA